MRSVFRLILVTFFLLLTSTAQATDSRFSTLYRLDPNLPNEGIIITPNPTNVPISIALLPDGTIIEIYSDGTIIEYLPGGPIIETHPEVPIWEGEIILSPLEEEEAFPEILDPPLEPIPTGQEIPECDPAFGNECPSSPVEEPQPSGGPTPTPAIRG